MKNPKRHTKLITIFGGVVVVIVIISSFASFLAVSSNQATPTPTPGPTPTSTPNH